MDLSTLKDTPTWDWPEDTANQLLKILRNREGSQAECKLAAELAGGHTIIDDKTGSALLSMCATAARRKT